MKQLEAIGMQANWIYEVIVSVFYHNSPYATPIGIWTEDFDTVEMEIYKGSTTLKGIMKEKEFAANLVADMEIFYAALFDKGKIAYEDSERVKAPVIKNSPATIELITEEIKEGRESYHVKAGVVQVKTSGKIILINRAENLVLESLILATKLPYLFRQRIEDVLKENYRVIRKVAPGSEFENIIKRIEKITRPSPEGWKSQ